MKRNDPKDPMKRLLQESAMERAPANLIPDVMKAIEVASTASVTYKPLISKRGWVLIVAGFLLVCAYALFPIGGMLESSQPLIPQHWIPKFQLSVPEFPEIPQTAWTAALAFGVFGLLHLFWMKRQLTRQGLI